MVARRGSVYRSLAVSRSDLEIPKPPLVQRDGPSVAVFERNADALYGTQPSLVQRLLRVEPVDVVPSKCGEPTSRFARDGSMRWLHSGYEPTLEARRIAALVPASVEDVLLVGAGLGYVVAELVAARANLRLVVLEPELRLLRTTLSLFDVAGAVASGRLFFTTGHEADLAAHAHLAPDPFVLRHPPLASAYADALRHVRFLARSGSERGRVLVMDYKLLVGDLVQRLESERFAVRLVEPGSLSLERFDELRRSVRPSFLLSVNYSPELAFLATKHGLPYVSWTIDPLPRSRLRVLPGTDFSLCVAYAHRPSIVAELARLGVPAPKLLPLAAGALRVPVADEQELSDLRCNVSFAGVSLRVEYDALLRRLEQLGATPLLLARVERWLGELYDARAGDLAFCGLASDASELPQWLSAELAPAADPVELCDRANGALSYLLRMHRVESLRAFGVRAYGDDGWEPLGEVYRGRAAHGDELSRLYCASAVNLDVPRLYQRDIVTMRVFDVLACGGVLLTEPSAQLAELFRDGEHLYTYRDAAELAAKVQWLLEHPREARRVAERGRELVHREHLLVHRVRTILADIAARGWLSS